MKSLISLALTLLTTATVLTTEGASVTRRQRSARETSFLGSIINTLLRSTSDSHIQTTADLGIRVGYTVETHDVITPDGYILTVHHIPPYTNPDKPTTNSRRKVNPSTNVTQDPIHPSSDSPEDGEGRMEEEPSHPVNDEGQESSTHVEGEKVVFLQHGLMGSSDNWNTNTPHDSLAYMLSDNGYDVWMGNFRGNIYSRRHLNLSHTDSQFWRFSYDEMAKYDLPAMLEYVLKYTGEERLLYVGHSMGTTVFFAMMSTQPEYYQRRVATMVALAPVATLTSIASPIKYLAPLVNELHFILRLFGNDNELLTNRLLISLWDPYRVCGSHTLCENLQFMITGFDPARANEDMVPIILSHNPAGSSTQTLFHFAQGYTSGRFQQFDFGRKRNLKHYGQERPPVYDVSKINIPINLFWADNDWMTGEKDVRLLEQKLPHLETTHKIPNPAFSHLDFLWATDARSLVYEKVFNILEDAVKRYY
ncbi:hypothetical protein Pcinc_018128 [Petrolisthes cinctipes]|uniref:Uncharacterized protein n=1 Tax=Petrolisthes cinctipes TaxID=88211 RepID=A0AAE1FPC0_PETCI|nr:hypothetical protein Pcinc_018128 [Petrolisthes cinctipes]